MPKLQTLLLDAVTPLVHIVEEAGRDILTADQVAKATKSAIPRLGNAFAHMSQERQKKVISCLNKRVHPLAEDEDIFADAAPLLLGKAFETKIKDHLESLKCLGGPTRPEKEGRNF